MSLNDISDFFMKIYKLWISVHFIRKTIIKCYKRALKLNNFYDSLVQDKVYVIEIDEIYQGHNGKYIGVVHKDSMYLIKLGHLDQKSIADITKALEPVAKRFDKLKLVLTDGMSSYKSIISDVFDGVPHQLCHIHLTRDLFKLQKPFNFDAKKAYKKLKTFLKKMKRIVI